VKTITYFYRGGVERGTGNGYEWRNGYSETVEGSILYPWMTRRECQEDARRRGAKAEFANLKPVGPAPLTEAEKQQGADLAQLHGA